MSEMRPIPVVTTRKGSPTLTCRVLKGSGCLAFLLLFLLTAIGSASAAAVTVTLAATPTASPTYGTAVTIKATLANVLAGGSITFTYGTSSSSITTAFSSPACAGASVAAAAISASCVTGTTELPAGSYYFKAVYTPATGSATPFSTTTPYVVKQATTTVTWATPTAINYPTPLSSTQLNASTGTVTSTCVYTPASGAVPVVGTQTLSAACTPTDTTNYTTPAASTVSLVVNKGTPTYATWAPTAISYPTPLSSTQLNATLSNGAGGTANASCTYSPITGTVLLAGTQTLTAVCTPTDLTNFNTPVATSTTASLTVNKGTPTVTFGTTGSIPYGTTLSALLNATLSVPGTCSYKLGSTPVTAAYIPLVSESGSLKATCTPTDTANYSTPGDSTLALTVTKQPLVVTASSTTVSLGASAPTITPIYTGFLNSDNAYTPEVAANTVTCSVAANYSTTNAGNHAPWTNTCTGGASTANYTYTYVTGLTSLGTLTTTSLKITLAGKTTAAISNPAGTSVTLTALVTGTGAAGNVNFTYVDPSTSRTVSIPLCSSVALNSAYAFCTTSALPVSTNLQLVATFSDSTNAFATSSNPTPVAYAVTQTTTTISSLAAHAASGSSPTTTAVYGTSVTLTATVTGTGAAGTVSFTYGESPIVPIAACSGANAIAVTSGTAVCVTTALPVSSNEQLNAYFSNPTNAFSTSSYVTPSQPTPLAFAVTAAPASTTLAVTAVSAGTSNTLASVVYGSSVTMTATVTTGAVGTVAFTYNSGKAITGCTAVPLSAGSAPCTTTALPVASDELLVATFTPTSSAYSSSSSAASDFQVTVNAPTILLTAPGTANFGGSVALAVTGLPVGAGAVGSGDTLTFSYGTTALLATTSSVTCTNVVTISASGTATCNTIMLPVATSFVAASFTPGTAMAVNIGNGPFVNATKPSIIVSKGSPVVALTTSPSGTTYVGASVTLTATISPSSAMDTGAVAFTWGATSTPTTAVTGCSAQSVTTSNGVTTATCTTTDITAKSIVSPGNYLKAAYTPTTATNFNTITAATGNLIVNGAAATTTVLTVSGASPYYFGVNPQLTATVASSLAAGTVTFFNNGVSIGTATVATGVATLTPTTPLPVATNLITATFNSADTGTSGYTNSTSLVVPVTVVATPTTSTVYAITNTAALTVTGSNASSATAFTKTTAANADNSFVLFATIIPTAASGSTAAINGGNVSFYDVSSAGSVLLGTGKVASSSPGIASFKVNCAVASVSCSGPLSLGTRYFTANYGGVYNGTGVAQLSGSVSDTVPVVVSGIPTLTITASSPSVVIGATVAPVITPVYTISNGGPATSQDFAACTASTTVDSNGVSIYSCTSLPSFSAAGNRAPVCTTSTTVGHVFGPTTPVTTTGNAGNADYVTSCTGAKNGNYTISNVNGAVTVTGKTPTWRNFNAVQVTYGTAVTLGATTNSSGAITYAWSKSNGCALQTDGTYKDVSSATCTLTSLNGTTGNKTFSATSWPGTYYVTATVAADDADNYAKASTQRSVIVIPATPVVNWSQPKAIVYGAKLSTSAFPICSAKYAVTPTNIKTVTGTCGWATHAQGAALEPSANVASVGSFQTAIFTPASVYGTGSSAGYNTVTTSLIANVTPVQATLVQAPAASAIATGSAVYANGANVSVLDTSAAEADDLTPAKLNGTWSWTCSLNGNTCSPITVFPATVSVTFTPSSANYSAVSGTASVAQLTPTTVNVWPTPSSITFGQTLSNSALDLTAVQINGGTVGVIAGKFTWGIPSTVPPLMGANHECMVYTPTSAALAPAYSTTTGNCVDPSTSVVSVTVTKGTPTVTWSAVPATPIYSGTTLSTSTFPATGAATYTNNVAGTFTWDATDVAATTYPAIGTSTYLADFTASTAADWNVTKGQVSLTVNPCGFQDSKNSVYSVADYVTATSATQIGTATYPLTLAAGTDESVLCASGANTVLPTASTPQITQGSTNTIPADALSYGTNAAVLSYGVDTTAGNGAIFTIDDGGTQYASNGAAGSITTSGNYTSGVFASMGGTVDITNSSIATSGTYSSALGASYNGTLTIHNVTATTSADHNSVITTGVGGGQVTITGGNYTNNRASGTTDNAGIRVSGSCPLASTSLCTAYVASNPSTPWSLVSVADGVSGTSITAVDGAAVVVEGGNKVSINSTGGLTSILGTAGNNHGILLKGLDLDPLLQDATTATTLNPTTFTMTGGSLTYTCDAGSTPSSCHTGLSATLDQNAVSTVFAVTNTTALISLEDVTVYNNTNSTGDGNLLTAAQLSTGPATVTFNLLGEIVTGDVLVDTGSKVTMSLDTDGTAGTTWTGKITALDGSATVGAVNLTIGATSKWIVTGNVTLNSLTDADTTYANIVCKTANCTVTTITPALVLNPATFSN